MSKLAKTFRNRLSAAISDRGATAALIRSAEISRQTIDRWISGERTPDLDQVEAAAHAIGRPAIDFLFPGELPKPVVMKPTPEQALEVLRQAIAETRGDTTGIPDDILAALKNPENWDAVRAVLMGSAVGEERLAISEKSKDLGKTLKKSKDK